MASISKRDHSNSIVSISMLLHCFNDVCGVTTCSVVVTSIYFECIRIQKEDNDNVNVLPLCLKLNLLQFTPTCHINSYSASHDN